MSNYITKKVGDVCEIRRGASPRPIDEWMASTGVPWVKISDATKNDSRYIFNTEGFIKEEGKYKSVEVFPEDLIISNSATPALPKIMKIHACIHDGWLLAQNFNGVTRDYLYYQIKYLQKYLINQGNGSIFKNLKTDILKDFPIIIPVNKESEIDVKMQKRITNTLTNIEDKIENNNKIIQSLESLAKTIYDYWFLQFEFLNEDGKPYKSSGGKMAWNDEFKREVPEGWEVIELKDLIEFIKGKIPTSKLSKEINGENNIPYITIDAANDGETLYCNPKKLIPLNGETIMVMDGAASGDVYIGQYGILGSTFAKINCKRSDISDSLIYMLLDTYKSIYKKSNTGSTVPHANPNYIKSMKFCFPRDCINISNRFDKIIKNIVHLKNENKKLAQLRDFLLPLLMNGQVTFKENAHE